MQRELLSEWKGMLQQFISLDQITVSRYYFKHQLSIKVQLRRFSNASKDAYAMVAYEHSSKFFLKQSICFVQYIFGEIKVA